ncbi:THO complex subunit 5 homolog isoform X1 [Tribolium madens]|uniref:THO complex subunit 5 homolog isoform X1 n=1 Tax=Tribolium madens TaxID=41895 RepID=UPI001CF7508F|nr:THO complex subunit 5 homolog isoform X1 [Tribolium madens]
MVKESSSLKKKRKSGTSADNEAEIDIYKKSVEFEEKEALNRPNDTDAQIYFTTCKEIRQLFGEISELKMKSGSDVRPKIIEKTTEVCLLLVLLKKLNRMEKVRLVFPKEELAAEKQKVDSINLQYQNLLYEANHLMSEYRKCFQFKSKDEHIELVPVEEFFAEAPENLTKKFTKFDENDELVKHELRLARLEWELQQRIHLADMCKKLEEEKKKLEADIGERRNKLDKLGPLLSSVMEATKPVQEHLGLHIDKIQAEHKLASLLPNPLYLFYANIDAYRQVNDSRMSVEIVGDQEEASQWKELELAEDDDEEDEDNEAEIETQEVEEIVETKKRRHRKSVHIDPLEEKKRKLLQVHPLSVQVTVTTKDGPSIKIRLSYYPKLEIVTVSSSVDIPSNITGNAAREVLSNESVLVELVGGDFGLDSPNPCTPYQLKKVGLGSFQSLVPDLGYVYTWAQKMCGIDFLNKMTGSDHLSQTNVESVMKTIKKRLKSRYALAKQLEELERSVIPVLPASVDLPRTTISSLTKWSSGTYQGFCEAQFTEGLLEAELISPNDIFYKATITRDNANLQAFVVIKNDYPSIPPIFSLCLNYNGTRHSQNDDNIRDMERSINVDWNHEFSNANWLLSAQIMSLCVGLDIYLETEDPGTFQQNTMYIKSTCARNRRKPFKFRNIGVGVYTQ